MYKINKSQAQKIEKSIKFAACRFKRTDKPVLFHSLKITFYLISKDYSNEVIIASVLHDLIEDSDCTLKEIENQFGKEVGRLVKAVSFDAKIKDPKERYLEMFERTNKSGKKALVIKAADIFDNSHFYYLVKNSDERKKLLKKVEIFLNISKKKISQTLVWQDLNKQFKKLKRKL